MTLVASSKLISLLGENTTEQNAVSAGFRSVGAIMSRTNRSSTLFFPSPYTRLNKPLTFASDRNASQYVSNGFWIHEGAGVFPSHGVTRRARDFSSLGTNAQNGVAFRRTKP